MGIKVLTTSWLGDMKVGTNRLSYPAQLLDGLRDLLLNATWYSNGPDWKWLSMAILLSDTPVLPISSLAVSMGTTPAAWASKHARLYAIENTTTSVHVTTQVLADYFMSKQPQLKKW